MSGGSVVIGLPVQYGETTVYLFQENNAHHLVGQGHGRQGQCSLGPGSKTVRKTVSSTDGKGQVRANVIPA